MLSVLQIQVSQIEELQREKEELLTFDTSCLGLPSFSERFNEGTRICSYDFSQENRASSRTTIKGSPNLLGLSPQKEIENDEKKKKILSKDESEQESIFEEDDATKNKIQEILKKKEEEENKLKLQYEERINKEILKEKENFETEKQRIINEKINVEKRLKELESIENENRKTQKQYNKILEKNKKFISSGCMLLSNLLNKNSFLHVFDALKSNLQEITNKLTTSYLQNVKAEEHFNKRLKSTALLALRYNHVVDKTKKIKADDFYKGRILLDSFYA